MSDTKFISHYDLELIKALIENGDVFITGTAQNDAEQIGISVGVALIPWIDEK